MISGKWVIFLAENIDFYDELAVKAGHGDRESKLTLCRHFKKYIHNLARTFYEGGEVEDAEQDLWVHFLECLLSYDAGKKVHFRMYVMKRLRWYFMKRFRHRKVERRLIEFVEETEGVCRGRETEKEISLSEEEIRGILDQCPLTALQRKLLDQRLSGKTWSMIAGERKVSRRGIYGHVSRIRSRLLQNQEFQNSFLA